MGNFLFLKAEWPEVHAEAVQAERYAHADPRAACIYARRTLEVALQWVYTADDSLPKPPKNLDGMIKKPAMVTMVGSALQAKMDAIRIQGNEAVHGSSAVTSQDALTILDELFHTLFWIARRYALSPGNAPAPGLTFDEALVPSGVGVQKQSRESLRQLAQLTEEQTAAWADSLDAEELDAAIVALRKEIKAAKAANSALPDTHDYNERQTRELIIDLLLKEAGWPLDGQNDREFPVTGMPNISERGHVDYVLWDDDGKPLGLVEAKSTTRNAVEGQHQAKLYADCLEVVYNQRPVIFCTNGYQTRVWDDLQYPPREIQGFYTKDELRLLVQRRSSRQALAGVSISSEIAGRHYQARAIRRIGEAFEQHQRHALLVMATGAGKTRTVIGLVDQLMRANWAKRILFLADRKVLVKQAATAFGEHLPHVPTVNLLKEKNPAGRVFVSTYPTMMGLINQTEGDRRLFSPGYFDLIIVDEAHRSIYQKYGAIFDYFDSLLVGLTATPKDEVDRNTYRRFHLENGVPTDVYGLDEAVKEGYLVPAEAVEVPLKFPREGIRYADLPPDEKERWDELEWDDEGRVPDSVNSEEVNKYLFNDDTVDKALETLMTHGLKVAGGDRLGKTIIFAKNERHAQHIADRFNANYPEEQGTFAQVITHRQDYAEDLIDKFSQKEKAPHIAISVDMLDTGIDVPEVVNLVFFKLVRSQSKFWQMVGRGTRLCADLHGPGRDKDSFRVFDLCRNVEFFNLDLMKAEGKLHPSLSEQLFQHRVDLLFGLDQRKPDSPVTPDETPAQTDGTQSEAGLRHETAQRLQAEVAGMNTDNFLVRPHRREVMVYADFANWHRVTEEAHAELTGSLAGLPSQFREHDHGEEAKRFDLLVLRLQLAHLNAERRYPQLMSRVQEIASALLDQSSHPVIRQQHELLEDLTAEIWWQDVTLPMLEGMRRNLRSLVKFIERRKRNIVYTDFVDEQTGDLTVAYLHGMTVGTDMQRFTQKARRYLRAHEDHLAIQKLRRNRQITATDLSELEEIFIEAGIGTDAELERVKEKSGTLGLFMRSLTGLDRETASAAFDSFQAERTLTASQLDFLQQIVDFLAKRGRMDAGDLYEAPFTSIAPGGPEDLFEEADINVVVNILKGIHSTAVPTEEAS
ncbi:DEAD/DEAH box helicase family protein [Streptomyces albicerus]|uniref:DEAD/DEAH box helicase family protein n=1 Tax=Streptomyces albicerus TaxID=2569859 RepID=UPI00124B5873|nr:DEAD/DEAH box helicase family protein [Streptomyces albicerus]